MSSLADIPLDGWPRWTWRGSSWYMTAIGTIIAVMFLVWPALANYALWMRIFLTTILIVALLFLVQALIYSIKWLAAAIVKMKSYDKLYKLMKSTNEQLETAKKTLLNLIAEQKIFEISMVSLYREQMYITLRKKRGTNLAEGQKVLVIDSQDGKVMGEFELTEIRHDEYNARCNGFVDSLWLGWVYQNGKPQCSPPPHTVAIAMLKEGDKYE